MNLEVAKQLWSLQGVKSRSQRRDKGLSEGSTIAQVAYPKQSIP